MYQSEREGEGVALDTDSGAFSGHSRGRLGAGENGDPYPSTALNSAFAALLGPF